MGIIVTVAIIIILMRFVVQGLYMHKKYGYNERFEEDLVLTIINIFIVIVLAMIGSAFNLI